MHARGTEGRKHGSILRLNRKSAAAGDWVGAQKGEEQRSEWHIDAAQSHRRQLGEGECLYVHVLRGALWAAHAIHSGIFSADTVIVLHAWQLRLTYRRLPLFKELLQ